MGYIPAKVETALRYNNGIIYIESKPKTKWLRLIRRHPMADNDLQKGILDLIKVLDKGISMERNAQIFYGTAARNTKAPQGKKMYEWLVNFERNHESNLLAKRKELLQHPAMRSTPVPLLDISTLSEAATPDDLPPEPSDVDVLRVAIDGERKAYAFYNRKLTHAADEHLKTMFQTMAREEDKHIKILSEMRRRLQIDGIWSDLEAFEEK